MFYCATPHQPNPSGGSRGPGGRRRGPQPHPHKSRKTPGEWPCDFAHAQSLILAPASGKPVKPGPAPKAGQLVAQADFDPTELQDLGDAVPTLLELMC